jgi:hypothetical protein
LDGEARREEGKSSFVVKEKFRVLFCGRLPIKGPPKHISNARSPRLTRDDREDDKMDPITKQMGLGQRRSPRPGERPSPTTAGGVNADGTSSAGEPSTYPPPPQPHRFGSSLGQPESKTATGVAGVGGGVPWGGQPPPPSLYHHQLKQQPQQQQQQQREQQQQHRAPPGPATTVITTSGGGGGGTRGGVASGEMPSSGLGGGASGSGASGLGVRARGASAGSAAERVSPDLAAKWAQQPRVASASNPAPAPAAASGVGAAAAAAAATTAPAHRARDYDYASNDSTQAAYRAFQDDFNASQQQQAGEAGEAGEAGQPWASVRMPVAERDRLRQRVAAIRRHNQADSAKEMDSGKGDW